MTNTVGKLESKRNLMDYWGKSLNLPMGLARADFLIGQMELEVPG